MTAAVEGESFRRARRLIAVQALAGVVAGVVVASLVTVGLVLLGQHREINHQLDVLVAAPHTAAVASGTWVVTVDPSGTRVASPGAPEDVPLDDKVSQAQAAGTDVSEEATIDDREYQTLTRVAGGTTTQAGVDLTSYDSERHRLIVALALAGFGAGLVAAWLGARLGRRAVAVWDDALRRQRRFIADASHELRTPLARLALRADLLGSAIDAGTPRTALAADAQLLRTESAGLADIVDDLLLAAQLTETADAGELVDLSEVAHQAIELNDVLARDRGLDLVADLPDVAPVRGYAPSLRRVVDSLIDNALRHAIGRVGVSVSQVGDQVALVVADDGPGVEPDQADRVFERFAKDPDSPGFGIGLALVREVVQHHGGEIRLVRGAPGTRFEVLLPAEPVSSPRVPDDAP